MAGKTIAARMLDTLKISYELREYEWSEEELDAVSVARKVGLPPEQVFKTLVTTGDKTGVVVACAKSGAGKRVNERASESPSRNPRPRVSAARALRGRPRAGARSAGLRTRSAGLGACSGGLEHAGLAHEGARAQGGLGFCRMGLSFALHYKIRLRHPPSQRTVCATPKQTLEGIPPNMFGAVDAGNPPCNPNRPPPPRRKQGLVFGSGLW
jgi:Cys-tRNA(Pro)/Cys-tRNA(Cys) deacylase